MFLVILPKSSFSQGSPDDLVASLRVLDRNVHDSLYYELFKSSVGSEINIAKGYAFKTLALAHEFGHYSFEAKAYRAIAYVNKYEEKLDSARYFYHLGVDIAKKHNLNRTLMSLLTDLGILYDRQDSYDSALRFYHLALEIADDLDAKDGQAAIRNNIGLVFYYLNNYGEALEYYQSALEIKKKNGIVDDLPLNLLNIAIIYNEQGKYDDAIGNLDEVAGICQNNCDINIEANLNYGLGLSYRKKKEYEKSLPYLLKGYELAKKGNIKNVIAYIQYHLSDFRFREGDYVGAIELLHEAEIIANEINLKRLKRDIYESYSRIYDQTGNLEKVVEYQGKYMAMKDSIFNEQLASNLKDIQLDVQRKQSEVIIQQKDTEIERVRLITTLVGIISVLLVVVSILIYRTYRASHRMKKILEKEIEKRTGELVKSNADLTQMTQEYDQLVYRASHDIRGPLATLMGLTNIAKQDTEEPLRVRDYLAKIESTAHGLNQTLSQLME
ncbi:MAG: tetratricopeptide repeat protein, partial [Cyclobacteriaceae bacterium]